VKRYISISTLKFYRGWAEGKFMGRTYVVDGSVEMTPIDSDGYILNIGGGGEGIVGKLNGGRSSPSTSRS
jgi:hypothetical protein